MKAITISQPYASLIADGEKWVANLDWQRCPSYRGPLAIHAGRGTQAIVAVAVLETALWLRCASYRIASGEPPPGWLDDGLSEERYDEFLNHEHTMGPLCLVLGSVRKLAEPVSCAGSEGLWNVPEHLEERIMEAIG